MLGNADEIGIVDQSLAALGLLDLFGAREEGFEVAIGVQQLGGRLHANAGRTGYIVDTVPRERLDIDNLLRADAKFLEHGLPPERLVLHRVKHDDGVGDQLHQILVGRDNRDARALGLRLTGIGGNQIVSLEAFLLDGMGRKGLSGAAHERELRAQFFRRFGPVGLVLVVQFVPEGDRGFVKDAGEMGGPLIALQIFQQLEQHVAETAHSADWQIVARTGQRGQGVEGAEDVGAGIHQIEMTVLVDGGSGHGSGILCWPNV